MGGLPEEGLARAGVKVSSKVLISAAAADLFMLKVTTIKMFQFKRIMMWLRNN